MKRATEHSVEANERITAFAGSVLFVLLAVEGFTLLGVGRMLTLHELIGFALVGPVLLKLGATGWRFARYYTHETEYVRKGPPWLPMRVLAPLLVLSTVGVLGSGIALWAYGRDAGPWMLLHKASFIVWVGLAALHVLYYLWRVPALIAADLKRRVAVRGRGARLSLVVLSVAVGALLAAGTVGSHATFRHHDDVGHSKRFDDH